MFTQQVQEIDKWIDHVPEEHRGWMQPFIDSMKNVLAQCQNVIEHRGPITFLPPLDENGDAITNNYFTVYSINVTNRITVNNTVIWNIDDGDDDEFPNGPFGVLYTSVNDPLYGYGNSKFLYHFDYLEEQGHGRVPMRDPAVYFDEVGDADEDPHVYHTYVKMDTVHGYDEEKYQVYFNMGPERLEAKGDNRWLNWPDLFRRLPGFELTSFQVLAHYNQSLTPVWVDMQEALANLNSFRKSEDQVIRAKADNLPLWEEVGDCDSEEV